MYLEYDEFIAMANNGAGNVTEADYPAFEQVAETIVDAFTFSVLKKGPDAMKRFGVAVKSAMYHQISFMGAYGSIESFVKDSEGTVQSRSVNVGGTSESITYANPGAMASRRVAGLKVSPLTCMILAPLRAEGRVLR